MKPLPHNFQLPGPTVSVATEPDIPELIELINDAFAYQDADKGKSRIDRAGLMKKIAESTFLVWREHRGIAACCYIETSDEVVHFGLLCMSNGYKGGKIAPKILAATEEYAKEAGRPSVQLDYMSQAPWLKQYYERFGYKETGTFRDIGWSKLVQMEKRLSS